jgi:hypothetical protein
VGARHAALLQVAVEDEASGSGLFAKPLVVAGERLDPAGVTAGAFGIEQLLEDGHVRPPLPGCRAADRAAPASPGPLLVMTLGKLKATVRTAGHPPAMQQVQGRLRRRRWSWLDVHGSLGSLQGKSGQVRVGLPVVWAAAPGARCRKARP